MGRRHYFHTDHGGHSITVQVAGGVSRGRMELLVDGKEVRRESPQCAGTTLLAGELPDDPPHPFRVAVHRPRFGSRVPRCSLMLDGVEEPMAERTRA